LSIPNAGNRAISIASISGALILLIGTYLHPMDADPNDALAAFTEYAASHIWVVSHLMQLLGVILISTALMLLSRTMADGSAAILAVLGAVGATVSLVTAGALQAVDGVALKAMVDKWASAAATDKAMLFHATYAVRQIEIGLASIASIVSGLTFSIYGLAILADRTYPKWLGLLAILGGIGSAIAGVVIAYTGFSGLDMAIGMPANILLLVWMVALGAYTWRTPTRTSH
jgi:hypothetical protein